MRHNVLQIGDRFVKRWHCAVGQTAANVLLALVALRGFINELNFKIWQKRL